MTKGKEPARTAVIMLRNWSRCYLSKTASENRNIPVHSRTDVTLMRHDTSFWCESLDNVSSHDVLWLFLVSESSDKVRLDINCVSVVHEVCLRETMGYIAVKFYVLYGRPCSYMNRNALIFPDARRNHGWVLWVLTAWGWAKSRAKWYLWMRLDYHDHRRSSHSTTWIYTTQCVERWKIRHGRASLWIFVRWL